MIITNRKNSRSGNYSGFSTSLLLGETNTDSKEISIQVTDVEPNGMQFIHSHKEEQCYYIVSGDGEIIIDNEKNKVVAGDAIFIPSNSDHGIKNIGNHVLTYITANRPFGIDRENEIWPLTNNTKK